MASGVEFLGEYDGSALRQPPMLLCRPDRQVVEVSQLLYLVASYVDGVRDVDGIAEQVSEQYGRSVSAANVTYLLESKLRPLGILLTAGGAEPGGHPPRPVLSIGARCAILPPGAVMASARVLAVMFRPLVIVAVVAAFVAVDRWLFFERSLDQALIAVLNRPVLLLAVLAIGLVGGYLHELGHAAALRYAGGRPGRIGIGVYLIWPAFFTDVTDAYRLDRRGRLRTDLGGVYFNAGYIVVVFGAFTVTGFEPLLLVMFVQNLQIVQQLVPFVRTDGYYMLSDVIGVPDLYASAPRILRSLLPGSAGDEAADRFRFWPRVAVAGWLAATSVLTVALVGLVGAQAPGFVRSLVSSIGVQGELVGAALHAGDVPVVLLGLLQVAILCVSLLGLAIVAARLSFVVVRRLTRQAPAKEGPTHMTRITAADVASTAFAVTRRGYDRAEVDRFRDMVAAELGKEPPAPDLDKAVVAAPDSAAAALEIGELLRAAAEAVAERRRSAELASSAIVRRAEHDAEGIRAAASEVLDAAEHQAASIRATAKREAESLLAEARMEYHYLRHEEQRVQARLASVQDTIASLLGAPSNEATTQTVREVGEEVRRLAGANGAGGSAGHGPGH